jgi:hypothetical protein
MSALPGKPRAARPWLPPGEVRHGLLPELPSECMVSERFDLLAEPVAVQVFDGGHDPPVEEAAPVLQ